MVVVHKVRTIWIGARGGIMSKQANTKLIGGFVVGAMGLTVAGILLFGS